MRYGEKGRFRKRSLQQTSKPLLAVERNFERAGAEDHEEKFGETAGVIFDEEADGFAFRGSEFGGFFVPGVVDKKRVRAGGKFFCDGVAEDEFGDRLTIERDNDLALLRVVGGGAVDGERGGHWLSLGEERPGGK